jgi:uncharacterized delta-60 repeat protein
LAAIACSGDDPSDSQCSGGSCVDAGGASGDSSITTTDAPSDAPSDAQDGGAFDVLGEVGGDEPDHEIQDEHEIQDGAPDAGVTATCAMGLDPTFGSAGIAQLVDPPNPEPSAIALQADGKILVCGRVRSSEHSIVVARYTTTGTLDMTFGTGGVASLPPVAGGASGLGMAVQPDQKIVVVGYGEDSNRDYVWQVARLDDKGILDAKFGKAGLAPSPTVKPARSATVALLGDGSILVAGGVNNGNADYDFLVAKYDRNGSFDGTFGAGGVVTTSFGPSVDVASRIVVQRDGKIVVGGHTKILNDAGVIEYDLAIARYTGLGVLDGKFGAQGKQVTPLGNGDFDVAGMELQSTGAIVVSATTFYTPNDDFFLVRYTPEGVLDATFGKSGVTQTDFFGAGDYPAGLTVLPGDALLVAGTVHEPSDAGDVAEFGIARYGARGQLDTTLAPGGKLVTRFPGATWDDIDVQAVQIDGKLVVGGYARRTTDGVVELLNIARYGCQ